MSLTVRRKKAIGDNLRHMNAHCGHSTLPSLLWTYAVPPEFMTTVVPEYPALEQRLKGAARFSKISVLQPIIDLDHVPLQPSDLFERIGWRLLELYQVGYGYTFETDIQRDNVRALAEELGENQLESGTRRTFVKSVVHLLGQQHREEEERLSESEIRGFASRSTEELPALEGEEVF
jgi:hypothetical protein